MYEWFPDLYKNGGRTNFNEISKEVQDESVWSPLKSYMEKILLDRCTRYKECGRINRYR